MHRSKQHLYSIISPARATNAAGISRPRAIETANVKPHLTQRAKKAFISADIETNRCSGGKWRERSLADGPAIAFRTDPLLGTKSGRGAFSFVMSALPPKSGLSAAIAECRPPIGDIERFFELKEVANRGLISRRNGGQRGPFL
jgi:hypothetical protein